MDLNNDGVIIAQFLTNHPIDAVRIIENLKTDEVVEILESAPDYIAGRIVTYLNIDICVKCLQRVKVQKTAGIIDTLPLQSALMLFRHMTRDFRESILELLPQEKMTHLKTAISYPEGTVGAIMLPSMFALYEDMLVEDALKYLKKHKDIDVYYIYVLDRDHKLTGVLSLSEIFRSKSNQLLNAVMSKQVIKIIAETHYKLIVDHPGWQKYHILPVVDNNEVFQGVLKFKELYNLESNSVKKSSPRNIVAVSSALGELYRLGIASLIKSASDIYGESNKY